VLIFPLDQHVKTADGDGELTQAATLLPEA